MPTDPFYDVCPEPPGNDPVPGDHLERTAHQFFLAEEGYCPWCGAED
jgi:hypothetical protein